MIGATDVVRRRIHDLNLTLVGLRSHHAKTVASVEHERERVWALMDEITAAIDAAAAAKGKP